MTGWLRRLVRRSPPPAPDPASIELPPGALWMIVPPEGVRLLSSRPSKTGEGGQGVVARYSDGTTASAMVNSDGSVRVLFFRASEMVPAVPVVGNGGDDLARYTWRT
ncbi:MAG: hypothetical protein ACRDI2_14485 [Chloroflexota bacterium]